MVFPKHKTFYRLSLQAFATNFCHRKAKKNCFYSVCKKLYRLRDCATKWVEVFCMHFTRFRVKEVKRKFPFIAIVLFLFAKEFQSFSVLEARFFPPSNANQRNLQRAKKFLYVDGELDQQFVACKNSVDYFLCFQRENATAIVYARLCMLSKWKFMQKFLSFPSCFLHSPSCKKSFFTVTLLCNIKSDGGIKIFVQYLSLNFYACFMRCEEFRLIIERRRSFSAISGGRKFSESWCVIGRRLRIKTTWELHVSSVVQLEI